MAPFASLVMLLGTGCGVLGGGSPIRGEPEVPWVTDPKIDVDVNGDGLADLVMAGVDGIVSDCPINTGCRAQMRVWYGNEDFLFEPNGQDVEIDDVFGIIVAAGDINGDGYTDVFGTRGHATQGPDEGLMLGGPDGLTGELVSETTVAWSAGDVNCDGYSDFSYGVGIVWGGTDPAANLADAVAQSEPGWTAFPGGAGATPVPRPVGDVNGDGCSDLVWQGELIWGGPSGMTPSGIFPAMAGVAAWGPIDVNGDGIDDIFADGLWLGSASGVLTQSYPSEPYWGTGDLRDITGDGMADQLYATNELRVLNGSGTLFSYEDAAASFEYGIHRGGHELFNDDSQDPWFTQTADDSVLEHLVASGTVSDRSYELYWGRNHGSVGDFDGDGYRDYLIRSFNYAFLYRGGDRLDRRDNAADGIVLSSTGYAGVAGVIND